MHGPTRIFWANLIPFSLKFYFKMLERAWVHRAFDAYNDDDSPTLQVQRSRRPCYEMLVPSLK
jgi:hypothetical protein